MPIRVTFFHARANHPVMPRVLRSAVLLATVAAGGSGPAHAAAEFDLSGRMSINHFYYWGGFAATSTSGADGAPAPSDQTQNGSVPLTTLAPQSLAISGHHYRDVDYLFWDAKVEWDWDQSQTYSLSVIPAGGVVLHGEGLSVVTMQPYAWDTLNNVPASASQLGYSTNRQQLEFTLSDTAAYTLAGTTSGTQWVSLLRWNPLAQGWITEISGPGYTANRSFALSGSLEPGRYRIQNYDAMIRMPQGTGTHTWNYDLTLAATLAVPEASSAVMTALGLLLMAAARRRIGTARRRAQKPALTKPSPIRA